MSNKALHTVLYYQESAVDLVKLGIQSNVIYNQMLNPTQPLRGLPGVGVGGREVICCCFFWSFLRLPITWWVSHGAILPVVSTPWKSSSKYMADFTLVIWAPKDKIDSNELIVLAILSVFILSLSGSTNSAKDQQDSFWDQQSVRYCYW